MDGLNTMNGERAKRWRRLIGSGAALAVVLTMAVGCAGVGETVPISLQDLRAAGPASSKGTVGTIVVMPLEDRRSDKGPLGLRTHLGGGVTYFDVPGGKPGEALTRALVEYLKQKGWPAKVGPVEGSGAADITLTGHVEELTANAKSRFGSTVATVTLKAALQGYNAVDRSTVKMTLEGTRMRTIFWFESQDVQDLVTATLQEGLDKLLAEARLEGGALRLR